MSALSAKKLAVNFASVLAVWWLDIAPKTIKRPTGLLTEFSAENSPIGTNYASRPCKEFGRTHGDKKKLLTSFLDNKSNNQHNEKRYKRHTQHKIKKYLFHDEANWFFEILTFSLLFCRHGFDLVFLTKFDSRFFFMF
jgi:hypothetical protein